MTLLIMVTTMTLITFYALKGEVKHPEKLLCSMAFIRMVTQELGLTSSTDFGHNRLQCWCNIVLH